jgi:hypothetical protein
MTGGGGGGPAQRRWLGTAGSDPRSVGAGSVRSREIGEARSPTMGPGHSGGWGGFNRFKMFSVQIVQNKFKCFQILTDQKSAFPCLDN